eukprot:8121246-Ditylum_brightwellii.AAC.1
MSWQVGIGLQETSQFGKTSHWEASQEARSAYSPSHVTSDALAGLTINERNCNMHAISNFEDLSISSSDKSIQSIIGTTSVEGSDDESCKPASKK